MATGTNRTSYRLNVIGPFYVEDGCCTLCAVPDAIAPELFYKHFGDIGWVDVES